MTTTPAVSLRWMIARDMPDAVACVADTPRPWDAADFLRRLRRRNVIGMVATTPRSGEVVGVVVYELLPTRVRLLTLAVHPQCRGLGVGRALLAKVLDKGTQHGRRGVVATVAETETAALRFLAAGGLRAVRVVGDGRDRVVIEWLAGATHDAAGVPLAGDDIPW